MEKNNNRANPMHPSGRKPANKIASQKGHGLNTSTTTKNNHATGHNKKIAKILVPMLMVIIIAGIWFMQNRSVEPQEDHLEYPLHVDHINIEALLAYEMPMIIDFGADECDPCKRMAPDLQEINLEMQGKAIIQFVDVWKNPTASSGFPVELIPTQIFVYSDGTPYIPSDDLDIDASFIVYSHPDTNEHLYTAHQGDLTADEMRAILQDMGVS